MYTCQVCYYKLRYVPGQETEYQDDDIVSGLRHELEEEREQVRIQLENRDALRDELAEKVHMLESGTCLSCQQKATDLLLLEEERSKLEKLLGEVSSEIERLKSLACSHATGPGNEPCDLVAGTGKQLQLAQQLLWDIWDTGLEFDRDRGCPEDDTCRCEVIKRLNEALEGFEEATDGNS